MSLSVKAPGVVALKTTEIMTKAKRAEAETSAASRKVMAFNLFSKFMVFSFPLVIVAKLNKFCVWVIVGLNL